MATVAYTYIYDIRCDVIDVVCMLCSVTNVQTMEELRDVYQHFLLYYGTDIPKMKNFLKKQKSSPSKKDKVRTHWCICVLSIYSN